MTQSVGPFCTQLCHYTVMTRILAGAAKDVKSCSAFDGGDRFVVAWLDLEGR